MEKTAQGEWTRYCFASKFTNDVAGLRQKEKPISIILEEGRYTGLLTPKEIRTPKPWLYKTTENKRQFLLISQGELSQQKPLLLVKNQSAHAIAKASKPIAVPAVSKPQMTPVSERINPQRRNQSPPKKQLHRLWIPKRKLKAISKPQVPLLAEILLPRS